MKRNAATIIEVLAVVGIISVLVGLLIPAILKIREAAALSSSLNNLRQINLSLQNYASEMDGRLPSIPDPTVIISDGDRPAPLPMVAILPYLGLESLYSLHVSGAGPGTESGRSGYVAIFINPLDGSFGASNPNSFWPDVNPFEQSISSYALNAQFFNHDPRLSRMMDGTSQTVWLSEHYGFACNGTTFSYSVPALSTWVEQTATFADGGPKGYRPDPGDYYPITVGIPPISNAENSRTFQVRPRVNECDPRLPNAGSRRGLQVGLADGSVRILKPSISNTLFWGMLTPSAGEVLGPDD